MERPNVILFVTDDHAAWAMAHAGATGLKTPNLDRLAAKGSRFTQAVTPSPVCSPARATLMSGLSPSEVGIHDWLQEYDDEVASRNWMSDCDTLPEMLQRAGYQTYLSGKWHLGAIPAIPRGFDHAFGLSRKPTTHEGTDTYLVDGQAIELTGNRSELIGERACAFLETAESSRPFFLNVGFFATHSPYDDKTHNSELVEGLRGLSFEGMPREPAHCWAKPENGPRSQYPDEDERRKRWRGYFSGVMEIDREVGRILDTLDRQGEAENTLIIYTSDHGCCLGHHGIWGKGNGTRPVNFYETSLRVPLILQGGGFASGQPCATPVSHYDVFVTLAETCQLSVADGRERSGTSLKHIQSASRARPTRITFHEYGDACAIRSPEWKLIHRFGKGPDQSFSLLEDPLEKNPLELAQAPAALQTILKDYIEDLKRAPFPGPQVDRLARHNDHEPWRDGLRKAVTPTLDALNPTAQT